MKLKKKSALLIVLSFVLVTVFVVDKQVEAEYPPYDLVISGLVDYPMNFTYSELESFPIVSEFAIMQCVGGMGGWMELYNWTGIPLFFLLNVTGVKSWATEVVFYAVDGFSSSLTVERALHPTTLLALQANGTVLSHFNGYPYRLVVPCKYGYKWVRWITEIEVVDYDYKGTYESMGYSDEADIPDCTFQPTNPPFETFDIVLGSRTHSITALSNSTINSFDFTLRERICFNVTGPPNTKGYCYLTIPKELLRCDSQEEWQIWVNNTIIDDRKVMEVTNYTYIYFTHNYTTQEAQIIVTIPSAGERVHHDIGITDITTSKTAIGQDYNLSLSVEILNYSNDTETRNITVYANATSIASQNITLTNKNATTVTFTWNTKGIAYGNYTISAYTPPALGETYTDDNTFTDDWVVITIVGDVNGNGIVEGLDYGMFGAAWGSEEGDPNWDPNCDFNDNSWIEGLDYGTFGAHWGEHI
jgi:hypothetical protein